jgi:hypothetical protein
MEGSKMKRMNKRELKRIFIHFAGDGEGGVGGGSSGDSGTLTETPPNVTSTKGENSIPFAEANVDSSVKTESKFDSKTYLGSKKVNPEQRMLRNFDRTGMNKAKIDAFIAELGDEAFMTDEEIKSADEKIMKDSLKKNEKEEKITEKDEKEKKDKKTEDSTSEEEKIKDFYEKTGLDEKTFQALPEKVQEKLVSTFEESGKSGKAYKDAEEKYTGLKKDTELMLSDPVHAARNEEIRTGKAYIAKDMPQVGEDIISKLDELFAADDKAGAKKLLNDWNKKNVSAMVAYERSVLDRQVQREKLESGAHQKFLEIAKISNGRVKITEPDHYKLKEGHEEFKEFNEMFSFFKKKGYTLDQIANKHEAKELYNLFAISKGWDKERDKNIANNATRTLLEGLRNPKQVSTLDPRQRSTTAEIGQTQSAASEQQLVDEVAQGDYRNLNAAIEASEGRPKLIKRLEMVRAWGEKKRRETKK